MLPYLPDPSEHISVRMSRNRHRIRLIQQMNDRIHIYLSPSGQGPL